MVNQFKNRGGIIRIVTEINADKEMSEFRTVLKLHSFHFSLQSLEKIHKNSLVIQCHIEMKIFYIGYDNFLISNKFQIQIL